MHARTRSLRLDLVSAPVHRPLCLPPPPPTVPARRLLWHPPARRHHRPPPALTLANAAPASSTPATGAAQLPPPHQPPAQPPSPTHRLPTPLGRHRRPPPHQSSVPASSTPATDTARPPPPTSSTLASPTTSVGTAWSLPQLRPASPPTPAAARTFNRLWAARAAPFSFSLDCTESNPAAHPVFSILQGIAVLCLTDMTSVTTVSRKVPPSPCRIIHVVHRIVKKLSMHGIHCVWDMFLIFQHGLWWPRFTKDILLVMDENWFIYRMDEIERSLG
jgi:hypothetical protein